MANVKRPHLLQIILTNLGTPVLLFLLVTLGSKEANADPYLPWPSWVRSNYSIIDTFGPGLLNHLAATSRDVVLPNGLGDRATYELIRMGDSWERPLTCWQGTRPSGYIQTISYQYRDPTEAARVAFPIHAHLKYDSEKARNLAYEAPIFTLYVLELNTDNPSNLRSYQRVFRDSFSIERCAEEHKKQLLQSLLQRLIHSDPKAISVDDACLSKPFVLETHKIYEIRIEWAGDQICGESQTSGGEETSVALGDMVQFLADLNLPPPYSQDLLGEFKDVLPQISPSQRRRSRSRSGSSSDLGFSSGSGSSSGSGFGRRSRSRSRQRQQMESQ